MELLIILFALYGFFIFGLIYGCLKLKSFSANNKKPQNSFTIVVPFRNEKENLPTLLESFSKLDYPKELFEIILVDDSSDEAFTVDGLKPSIYSLQNERKSDSPKKDAINTAIQKAKFEWIITTDADCKVPKKWLMTLDNFIQNTPKAKMISGLVYTQTNKSIFQDFQLLDFMSLQSTTIGSFGIHKPFMCNGANFAYQKDFFNQLNGFSGNETIASGDDVFLLQKAIDLYSDNVFYLKSKNHRILTNPVKSWEELFYQRVRWASKTKAYKKNTFAKLLAIVVFLGNIGFIISLFGLFYCWKFLFLIVFKIITDLILIVQSYKYAPKTTKYNFLISSFIYPFFSVITGLYILFGKNYVWKNRKHKI